MEFFTLFLIALGLSMDAFAVSISNGLFYKNFKKSHMFLSSLTFGIFQGIMPTIGFFAGNMFFDLISSYDHWIAFILLGFIGTNMIIDAIRELKNDGKDELEIQTMYNMEIDVTKEISIKFIQENVYYEGCFF